MRKQFLFITLIAIAISGMLFLNSCNNDNDITPMSDSESNRISIFEKNYLKYLYSEIPNDSVKLIGFKTVYYNKNEAQELKEAQKLYKNELNEINKSIYYAEDFSYMRVYFPMNDAIVNYNGNTYEANNKGTFLALTSSKNSKYKSTEKIEIIGRKTSENVIGTDFNIVQGNRIMLTESLDKRITDYNYRNTYVFDLGERNFYHHHAADTNIIGGNQRGSGIACYKNHKNRNCSTAFGYNGRCPREYVNCMDYNGWPAKCSNKSKAGFVGSDCQRAMAIGQCWNEL